MRKLLSSSLFLHFCAEAPTWSCTCPGPRHSEQVCLLHNVQTHCHLSQANKQLFVFSSAASWHVFIYHIIALNIVYRKHSITYFLKLSIYNSIFFLSWDSLKLPVTQQLHTKYLDKFHFFTGVYFIWRKKKTIPFFKKYLRDKLISCHLRI